MSSKHLRGDINYSWPTAEIAVMGAKVITTTTIIIIIIIIIIFNRELLPFYIVERLKKVLFIYYYYYYHYLILLILFNYLLELLKLQAEYESTLCTPLQAAARGETSLHFSSLIIFNYIHFRIH